MSTESLPKSEQDVLRSEASRDGTLVLVVHGIGAPLPGQTVRTFATCLAHQYPAQNLEAIEESVWIPVRDQEEGKPDLLEPIATHIQRGEINGERVVFSEVFWADLSLVRSSLWGVLTAVFEILFGLPHVVRESLRVPKDEEIAKRLPRRRMRILGWFCNRVANILLGPVAALNGLLILLLVATVGVHASVKFTEREVNVEMEANKGRAKGTIVEAPPESDAEQIHSRDGKAEKIGLWMFPGMLLIIAGVIAARRLYRKGRWQQFWKWVMWCSVLLLILDLLALGLVIWKPEWGTTSGSEPQRNVLEIALSPDGPRGFIWHGAVIVLLLVLALVANSLLMILALLVWFSAFFLKRRAQFPWFRYPLHAGFVATALMMGLWSLLIPLLWQFGLLKLLEALPEHLDHLSSDVRLLHGNGLPLMVAYTVFAVVLGLCIWAVWLWRWNWSTRFKPSGLNPSEYGVETGHPPRLIAHEGIVWTTAALTFLGSVLFLLAFIVVFWPRLLPEGWMDEPFLKYVVAGEQGSVLAENVTLVIITAMGIFGSFLLTYLVNGADIVLDVINHFREGDPETKRAGTGRYWKREAIYDRFFQVLREMLRRERPRRLCIVSHSQGTVIAIDNLNSIGIGGLLMKAGVEYVDLVTMGSPFEHLYQYYFPASYPTLAREFSRWGRLQHRVNRWTNIFRVDDFVGTHILDPDDPERKTRSLTKEYWSGSGTDYVKNLPVPPRGHNDYWTDLAVLEVLKELDLFEGNLQIKAPHSRKA